MKFPEEAQTTVKAFVSRIKAEERRLEDYLAGLRDGMGLDRDFKVNLAEMKFEKVDNNA